LQDRRTLEKGTKAAKFAHRGMSNAPLHLGHLPLRTRKHYFLTHAPLRLTPCSLILCCIQEVLVACFSSWFIVTNAKTPFATTKR